MKSPDLIRKFQRVLPGVREWIEITLAAHQDRAVPLQHMDFPRLEQAFPPDLLMTTIPALGNVCRTV